MDDFFTTFSFNDVSIKTIEILNEELERLHKELECIRKEYDINDSDAYAMIVNQIGNVTNHLMTLTKKTG